MANIWDDLMKMLVRAHPQDFVSFILNGAQYVGDVTNELKVRSVEADFLCKAKLDDEDVMVHGEFQRRHDGNMQRRMWEYNSATDYLTGLPVHSFALYLWKDEHIVEPIYKRVSGGEEIHRFAYKNIFFWETPPEKLLSIGLEGMLPLLPLTKGAMQARDEIVGMMINGLREAHKEDVLALGYAFAGLVYETEADQQWLKRRFQMFHDILEGSWSYREMVQKGVDIGLEQGIEKGIEKGLEQGELRALNAVRPVLIHFVETRFPELTSLAKQQAERINKPELLSAVLDKLFIAQTIERAKQVLMEIDKTTDMPS